LAKDFLKLAAKVRFGGKTQFGRGGFAGITLGDQLLANGALH
jgi:hypothetical protein